MSMFQINVLLGAVEKARADRVCRMMGENTTVDLSADLFFPHPGIDIRHPFVSQAVVAIRRVHQPACEVGPEDPAEDPLGTYSIY